MKPTILIRPANIADLDPLVALFDGYRQFYGQPSDPTGAHIFLAERLRNQDSVIFLALTENDEALGFTQLYPSFTSTGMKRIFILNDLFVLPDARQRGVGTSLLDAAVAYGREVGAARLTLSTAVDNLAAQGVYEAHGWVRDTRFYSYNRALD